MTLNLSYTSSVLFCPLTNAVNHLALKSRGRHACRSIYLLHYLATPIDTLIQAIAMLAFTPYDHFRNISSNYRQQKMRKVALKSCATLITLPLKIIAASCVAFGFVTNGGYQLLFPLKTLKALLSQGSEKSYAYLYFYASALFRKRYDSDCYQDKPVALLKPSNLELNPFWKRREALLEKIDGPLRERIGGLIPYMKVYPEYLTLLKDKASDEAFVADNELTEDPDVNLSWLEAKESLKKLQIMQDKIYTAKVLWKEIDSIVAEKRTYLSFAF